MKKVCYTYDTASDKFGSTDCEYGCCGIDCCQWSHRITYKPIVIPTPPTIPPWNWDQYTLPDIHIPDVTVKPPMYINSDNPSRQNNMEVGPVFGGIFGSVLFVVLFAACINLRRRRHREILRNADVECAPDQTRLPSAYNQPVGLPRLSPDLPSNSESSNQTGRAPTRLILITDRNPGLRVGDLIRIPNARSAPASNIDNSEQDQRTATHAATVGDDKNDTDMPTPGVVTNGDTLPSGENNQSADLSQPNQAIPETNTSDSSTHDNPRSDDHPVPQDSSTASGRESRDREGPVEFIIFTPRFPVQTSQPSTQSRPADSIMNMTPESPSTRRAGNPWPYVASTNPSSTQSDNKEDTDGDSGFTCPGLTSMWDKERH